MSQTQINIDPIMFQSLEEIIFGMNKDNIPESVDSSLGFYVEEFPYSFNLIICRLIYSCFVSNNQNTDIFFILLSQKQ